MTPDLFRSPDSSTIPTCWPGSRAAALDWQPIGTARALYSRVAREAAPRAVSQVQALQNYGLVGDRHARPQSPRQLLIAGQVAYERFGLPAAALRENLLVDFSTEQLVSGDLLRIGREVVLWLTFHCEPCSLLERRCPGTLKALGTHRGMLARVLRGGTIAVGDEICRVRSSLPAMSNEWQARVLAVARSVPPDRYVVYRQLAELAGVPTAYCRAFPRVLSRLPGDVASRVRSGVMNGALSGRQWDGVELFQVGAHLA